MTSLHTKVGHGSAHRVITASIAAALLMVSAAGTALAEDFGGTTVGQGTPVNPNAVIIQATPAPVNPPPAPAGPTTRDGSSADRAMASCWEIKQTKPTAPNGIYWLYTPALGAPGQFYCDMTTDGGGWVLIGRGREGWSFLDEGQGTASEVAANVTGPAAFAPKLLTGDTVRGVLNNGAVKDLTDGLRIRRATNTAGTAWQEVRLHTPTFGSWRWVLNGGYPVDSASFNGAAASGTFTTQTTAADTSFKTVRTAKQSDNNWLPGFAYGVGVAGTSAATSYLWSPTNGTQAIPFAQLYLRPTLKISSLSFPSVAAGLPASTVAPVVDNRAQPQTAGVSGLANGFTSERDTEVRAIVQIGQTMYVGGNFATVNNYATGSSTAQPYLAAFNVSTGAPVPGFAPKLNGKVNALVALPNGKLGVGGEFKTVNGVARAGLVALEPVTGATVPGFSTAMEYRSGNPTVPGTVTSMSVVGTTLYIGGNFTHVSGGGSGHVYAKRGAKLDATTGRPNATWNPAFNGTPIFVMASSRGDRVYFGGFMTTMNDGANPAKYFAVVNANGSATPVPGLANPVYSATWITYQQTAAEVGDKFWLGGSEHAFFLYNRTTMALERSNIAASDAGSGGDFQASAVDKTVIYGSCHCILSNNMGNGRTWPNPATFDDVDSIRYIAAYDVTTGRNLPDFLPQMRTRAIRGPWALTMDTNGCLWAGGDTTETRSTAGSWQKSGGFARHCRVDTTPPLTPTGLKTVANADGTTTISWSGPASGPTYRLYRGDTVVWSGTALKATLPTVSGAAYALTAVDRAGNVSPSSARVLAP